MRKFLTLALIIVWSIASLNAADQLIRPNINKTPKPMPTSFLVKVIREPAGPEPLFRPKEPTGTPFKGAVVIMTNDQDIVVDIRQTDERGEVVFPPQVRRFTITVAIRGLTMLANKVEDLRTEGIAFAIK